MVWQAGIELVAEVYRLSAKLPFDEKYGLRSQLQRAAVSVPANIAEGWGRMHRKEYLHHLSIAQGSLAETETHLIIAVRLGFLKEADTKVVNEIAKKTGKMLIGLRHALQKTLNQ